MFSCTLIFLCKQEIIWNCILCWSTFYILLEHNFIHYWSTLIFNVGTHISIHCINILYIVGAHLYIVVRTVRSWRARSSEASLDPVQRPPLPPAWLVARGPSGHGANGALSLLPSGAPSIPADGVPPHDDGAAHPTWCLHHIGSVITCT